MNVMLFALLLAPPVVDPPPIVAAPVKAGKSWVPPKAGGRRGYTECLAAVDRGETVFLCVGQYATRPDDYFVPELKHDDGGEVRGGVYRCWLDREKGRQMQPVDWRAREPVAVYPLVPRLFNPPLVPVPGGS